LEVNELLNSQDAIRVDGLCVRFGGKLVLRDLTLAFPARQLTIVIGRSGSGKTTLLRALNRLNEWFPGCESSGAVRMQVNGSFTDVYANGMPLSELRRRVGMVFQTPNILPVSIFKNLALPLTLVLGVPKAELPDRIEEALKASHLWDEVKDRLLDRATTLSGGQQQRLCLARALALQPSVLLLDEPTSSLDYRAAMKIEELLLDLKTRYTIIAVSHSLSQAQRLADTVIVLSEGQIARQLSSNEFADQHQTKALLEEIF
jgi:phosphate transport system ATP-binding protein